jgi:hypothetical protein
MATQWINHFIDISTVWDRGQPDSVDSSTAQGFGGANVRVYETARSGTVVMSPQGASLSTYGNAEVYLRIVHNGGNWEYLSAPLTTPVDLRAVQTIELHILFLIGNASCVSVRYHALVNAHCVYEII